MKETNYSDAATFLVRSRAKLESNEAANSLMLGICGQLVRQPQWYGGTPYLKTVEDDSGLVVAAVMTPPHKLVVYGHQGDLEGGTRVLAHGLAAEGRVVPGVLGPSKVAKAMAESWSAVTGGAHDLERRQRVYEVRQVVYPLSECGRLRLAAESDLELVTRWRCGFHQEIFGTVDEDEAGLLLRVRIKAEDIYLWDAGQPVSMAMRTRPTRNGISVGLIYTPPEFRRRGYATACVAELSRLLLKSGWRFCALFADQANRTAVRIYERIGYEPVCDYDEYAFSPAG